MKSSVAPPTPSEFQTTLGFGIAIGALTALALYIGLAVTFDSLWVAPQQLPEAPIKPYGVKLYVTLVIAANFGFAMGLAAALGGLRKWLPSLCVGIAACMVAAAIIASFWYYDVARNGHDPSEYIVYWPFCVLIPFGSVAWLVSLVVFKLRDF